MADPSTTPWVPQVQLGDITYYAPGSPTGLVVRRGVTYQDFTDYRYQLYSNPNNPGWDPANIFFDVTSYVNHKLQESPQTTPGGKMPAAITIESMLPMLLMAGKGAMSKFMPLLLMGGAGFAAGGLLKNPLLAMMMMGGGSSRGGMGKMMPLVMSSMGMIDQNTALMMMVMGGGSSGGGSYRRSYRPYYRRSYRRSYSRRW